jgi:hypothetical protein
MKRNNLQYDLFEPIESEFDIIWKRFEEIHETQGKVSRSQFAKLHEFSKLLIQLTKRLDMVEKNLMHK